MAKRKRLSFDSPVLPAGGAAPAPAPIAGVVADASAAAALAEVTDTLQAARDGGRMVIDVPLDALQLDYLVRDRIAVEDEEMAALKDSLRARGQQVPVEVARLGPDRYGLISGWRRCHALKALHAETGEDRFAAVQALVRQPAESSEAYRAMVEENEIRVGLSYYERARIVARAVEQGVFADTRAALQGLFGAASRAKRSKIGTFLPIVAALDGHLRFPVALTERAGLSLGRALEDDPDLADRARAALAKAGPATATDEAALLAALLKPPAPVRPDAARPARAQAARPEPAPAPAPPRAETLCPGIEMLVHDDGSLTLRGPRVDDRLQARLRGLLSHDKGV